MASGKFDAQNQAQSAETTLDVLGAVSEDETLSQRNLADRLGIALGLTNAVLKRCVKKGLLKIQQVPARRYAYYLTPKGFAEKSRLTAEYLSFSLQFYRQARQEYGKIFQYCKTRRWTSLVIVGATDMAEIASLASAGEEVDIVGILDPGRNEATFCGIPVFQTLEGLGPDRKPDAVILADLTDPQATYDRLIEIFPVRRVLHPKALRITRRAQDDDMDPESE